MSAKQVSFLLFVAIFANAATAQVFTSSTGVSSSPTHVIFGKPVDISVQGWDFLYAEPFFWTGTSWASGGSFSGSVSQNGWVNVPKGGSVKFQIPSAQDAVYAIFACNADTNPQVYHCNGDVVLDAKGQVVSNDAKWMIYRIVTQAQPVPVPISQAQPVITPVVAPQVSIDTSRMGAAQLLVQKSPTTLKVSTVNPALVYSTYFCDKGQVACGGKPLSNMMPELSALMCCPVNGFSVDKEIAALGPSAPGSDALCPSGSAACGYSHSGTAKVEIVRCCAIVGATVDSTAKRLLVLGFSGKVVTSSACSSDEVVCGTSNGKNSYAHDAYCCKIK